MILDQEQHLFLKKLVRDMVSYKETYSELYDHILTGIEKADENQELIDVVDQIVEDDFGSYRQLFKIEDERAKIVAVQVRNEHWNNVKQYFKIPLLVLTVAISLITYYAVGNLLSVRTLQIAVSIIAFLPVIIIKLREPIDNKIKRSIKEDGITSLSGFCMLALMTIIYLPTFFISENGFVLLSKVHSVFIVVLFIFFLIYVFSFLKLFKKEFILSLTT